MTAPLGAETIRFATYDPDFVGKGPGLFLRDLEQDRSPAYSAALNVITAAQADVLLLTGVDYDDEHLAIAAIKRKLNKLGADYPFHAAAWPNSGIRTGVDMDGDGRGATARDTQGYGRFPGHGGMVLLSRYPVGRMTNLSDVLWKDHRDGIPAGLLSKDAAKIQKLSSVAHWDVEILHPLRPFNVLAFSATPPVFDGPEDRNGHRNAAELSIWISYIRGQLPMPKPEHALVLLGKLNIDPVDGEGRRQAWNELLHAGIVQDPVPGSKGAVAEADASHNGAAATDTADWSDPPKGPGNLRVDYVLPGAGLYVTDAGVVWPEDKKDFGLGSSKVGLAEVRLASRHRLVWVDIDIDR